MNEKYIIPSVHEVKHFLLDIPVVKKEYQANAVKYALKSLYPGNEDTTIFDYFYAKNKVVGIAANLNKKEKLCSEGKTLISPVRLLYKSISNGIILGAGRNWLELVCVKKEALIYIKDFYLSSINTCLKEIDRLLQDNFSEEGQDLKKLVSVMYFDTPDFETDMILRNCYFNSYESISYIYKKNNLSVYSIFSPKKKKKPYILLIAMAVLAVSILDFNLFRKSKNLTKEVEAIKKEYNSRKSKSSPENSSPVQQEKTEKENQILFSSILTQIYNSAPNLRIISISVNGNSFRLEAEKENAIKAFNNLSSTSILKNLVLQKAIPQPDGTDYFIIQGKIEK